MNVNEMTNIYMYHNFRSFTCMANYCIWRKKEITDYPHWWITRTLLYNFFGGEKVTLRRYISVFQFRHAHNSLSILAYTLLIKLYSKNTGDPYPNLNISYLTECEFVATFCASDCSAPCWFVERKLGQVLKLEW